MHCASFDFLSADFSGVVIFFATWRGSHTNLPRPYFILRYLPELQDLAMVIFSDSILLLFICVVSLRQSIWAFSVLCGSAGSLRSFTPEPLSTHCFREREAGEEVLTERPICSQELKNEIGLNGEIEQVVNFDGARKLPAPLPPSQLDTQVAQQNHSCQIIGHLIFSKSNLFVFSKNTY